MLACIFILRETNSNQKRCKPFSLRTSLQTLLTTNNLNWKLKVEAFLDCYDFCNSNQFLCLGSQNTRSQKRFYASVDKKLVPKASICLGCGESKPKTHIFGLGWQMAGAKMWTHFSFSSSPRSPFLSTTLFLSSLSSLLTTCTSTVAATTLLRPPSHCRHR